MRYNSHRIGVESRQRILTQLGYPSYEAYLRSNLWAQIRSEAFKRYGYNCRLCGKLATEIHHKDYKRQTLLGARLVGLFPVCRQCHRWVEFDEHGNKLILRHANGRIRSVQLKATARFKSKAWRKPTGKETPCNCKRCQERRRRWRSSS